MNRNALFSSGKELKDPPEIGLDLLVNAESGVDADDFLDGHKIFFFVVELFSELDDLVFFEMVALNLKQKLHLINVVFLSARQLPLDLVHELFLPLVPEQITEPFSFFDLHIENG